jgi:hypothetical protein
MWRTVQWRLIQMEFRVSLGKDLVQVAVKQLPRLWHWIDPLYCQATADPQHASCPLR